MYHNEHPLLLLVDDEPTNLHVLRHTLNDHYRLLFAKDGKTALNLAETEQPDLILLDVMMPDLSGYDVCTQLKSQPHTAQIPIIFVTALKDENNEQKGLELGAVDYITKPISPAIVRARVQTHLSLVQAEEVLKMCSHLIQSLGIAAEYKDNETGMHTIRMSHYSYALAKAMGYSDHQANLLLQAAPMHDVGKIGIPDSILLKPGKLTEEEWETMRSHTLIGERIIGTHHSPLIQMAARIARSHHEKWDGTGYPEGLKENAIPLEAQIIALADVFDALTSVRPYKKAWSIADTVHYIHEQKGKHFNPALVEAFDTCLPEFLKIQTHWSDS